MRTCDKTVTKNCCSWDTSVQKTGLQDYNLPLLSIFVVVVIIIVVLVYTTPIIILTLSSSLRHLLISIVIRRDLSDCL